MKRSPALLMLLSLGFGPPVRGADEVERKRAAGRLLEHGNALFMSGRFEAALEAYENAYAAYPSAKMFLNLGKVHLKLEDPIAAAHDFERFLDESGAASDSVLGKEAAAGLAAATADLGEIAVLDVEPGAEVSVDGKKACKAPCAPVRVLAGPHEISVSKPGFSDITESILVAPRSRIFVPIRMLVVVPVPQHESVRVRVDERAPIEPAPDHGGLLSAWWFWSSIAAIAIAGAGVSIVLASHRGAPFVPNTDLGVTPTDRWQRP